MRAGGRPCGSGIESVSLEQAVRDPGAAEKSACEGQTAFCRRGRPKAFVLLKSGRLTVHFRTEARRTPWAECRATDGQDCIPMAASILSDRGISVRATCMAPCTWIELPPTSLVLLVYGQAAFRRTLFAQHVRRLPAFFARISSKNAIGLDQRIADWLLGHAASGTVTATPTEIAADLITVREVISRKLRGFAAKGWIVQGRGRIHLEAPDALLRLARGSFSAGGKKAGQAPCQHI